MSVVVAYGNSNTWGCDPASGARFAPGDALDRRDGARSSAADSA